MQHLCFSSTSRSAYLNISHTCTNKWPDGIVIIITAIMYSGYIIVVCYTVWLDIDWHLCVDEHSEFKCNNAQIHMSKNNKIHNMLYNHVSAISYHKHLNITASQNHSVTISQYHKSTVSQYHSITASQYYYITKLQHYKITIFRGDLKHNRRSGSLLSRISNRHVILTSPESRL